MHLLKVINIQKNYGNQAVLTDVSFVVHSKERIGIVGQNGVGKSTLLRIIAGLEVPDDGKIDFHSSFAYMPQKGEEGRVGDVFKDLFAKNKAKKLIDRLDLAYIDQFGDISNLSGGEKSKLYLASALSKNADLILLDEPTNNLDFESLKILEQIINDSKDSFLIISHDREFLDRVCGRIFEIDEFSHSLREYAGNYSSYLQEKEKECQKALELWEDYHAEHKRLEKSMIEKKEWAQKAQKGPKMTDSDKYARGFFRNRSKVTARAGKSIETRLEKLEEVPKPKEHWKLRFDISPTERSGDLVLRAVGLEKRIGKISIGPIDMSVTRKDRIAIVGKNGSGKTTLLNLLVGKAIPDNGNSKLGSNVILGFLEQVSILSNDTLLNNFKDRAEMNETQARKLLHHFGIESDDIKKNLKDLSPGERMRFEIAVFVAKGVNFLVLDEPTNNLDLETIEELERVVKNFSGTLLIVSHDRRFLKNIDLTNTYSLESGFLEEIKTIQ